MKENKCVFSFRIRRINMWPGVTRYSIFPKEYNVHAAGRPIKNLPKGQARSSSPRTPRLASIPSRDPRPHERTGAPVGSTSPSSPLYPPRETLYYTKTQAEEKNKKEGEERRGEQELLRSHTHLSLAIPLFLPTWPGQAESGIRQRARRREEETGEAKRGRRG